MHVETFRRLERIRIDLKGSTVDLFRMHTSLGGYELCGAVVLKGHSEDVVQFVRRYIEKVVSAEMTKFVGLKIRKGFSKSSMSKAMIAFTRSNNDPILNAFIKAEGA